MEIILTTAAIIISNLFAVPSDILGRIDDVINK
jgi:hypothetical protein